MSTTTQKHKNFVSEPMKDKPVTDLAGIGPVVGEKMVNAGHEKASEILGKYLMLKRNKDHFIEWVKTFGTSEEESHECVQCLSEWCDGFL